MAARYGQPDQQSSGSLDVSNFVPTSIDEDRQRGNMRGKAARYGQPDHQASAASDVSDFTPTSMNEMRVQSPAPGPSQKSEQMVLSEFERLMATENIIDLKLWIQNHYRQTEGYVYFREEIEYIISQYMPNFRPGTCDNPSLIIQLLKKILPVKERIDIPPDLQKVLEGAQLAASVSSHKKRILDSMIDMEIEFEILKNEVHKNNLYITELEAKLAAAMDQIAMLQEDSVFGPIPSQEKFLAEMHMKLREKENLQSSLREEVERSRNVIDKLNREVMQLKSELVNIDHERILEIAEIAQGIEIDESLKRALMEKINSLNANTEECKKALNDWMSAIQSTFSEKKDSIEKTKEEVKMLDTEVAKQEVAVQNLSRKRNEINMELKALRESIAEEEMEFESLEHYMSQLEQEKLHLSHQAEQTNQELASLLTSTPTKASSILRSPPFPYIDQTDSMVNMANFSESPEQFRKGDSPGQWSRNLNDPSPLSFDSSRAGKIPEISIRPPSPMSSAAGPSLHIPSPMYSAAGPSLQIPSPVVPRTQTISPRRTVFPGTSKINPSTQSITNRFDIGKSLNMQTIHSGLTSPYHQNTRVESDIPIEGSSRMIDSPVNIRHMADLSPSHFVTPFISTSRFGYTDPKAYYLNLPPGGGYELDTVLKKRLLLTSPQREEPLLVDIGVQPKPLVQTSSGEHFVCDISLDVQQAENKPSNISPVFTYGVPPAVTPTSTRRHGQFTPKGIFKKKHFNLRKVIGPHYESPGEHFPPHYLPFDHRSPITGLPPPRHLSDGSISWEKLPGLDDTYDASMMNRTFDASASPVMNRTFDASAPPVMNRTFDGSPPHATNRTYGKSPSPLIKGPSYRYRDQYSYSTSEESSSPIHGRTFDYSSSPGSLGRSPYDRTFDDSPSHMTDRAFGMASSPVIQRNALLNQTYEGSMSPRSGGTSDRSMSPKFDATFDRSSSPRSGGTYDRSMSPRLDGTFDRSMSSRSGGTYDRSMSPRLDGTFDRTSSPRSGGTYDRSMSPRLDATFDRTSSPRSGGTYDSSMSPRLDGTFNRSMSPRSGGTYDRSMSPGLNDTFDSHSSPRSGGSPNSSSSPLNRAFVQDHSFGMDGSFGRSPSPRLDNTFDHSPSILDRAFQEHSSQSDDSRRSSSASENFGSFPRVNRTHNVSVSPRLDRTYNVSYPHVMDRPFIENASPELNRSMSPQRFNIPQRFNVPQRFNESDESSMDRTFDTYSSQNSALADHDWSFDSGYSSGHTSNQSGLSERSP